MDMRTEAIKLSFLTGPPGRVPRLSGLRDLLGGLLRQIVEIEVVGTVAKPRTRTVPLRSLDDIVRTLTNPS